MRNCSMKGCGFYGSHAVRVKLPAWRAPEAMDLCEDHLATMQAEHPEWLIGPTPVAKPTAVTPEMSRLAPRDEPFWGS
jgi:hypothetical protein